MLARGKPVLDHDTRKMVYNHIVVYPGVTFSVLKTIFNLSESTLRYHLKCLEKSDGIHSKLNEGKRCYYPNNNHLIVRKILDKKKGIQRFTKLQEQILIAISKHPGITQKELIKKTGMSRFTINYNINKFITIGLIRKYNIEANVCYEFMTDDFMEHEITKALVIKLLKNEIDERTFNGLKAKLEE